MLKLALFWDNTIIGETIFCLFWRNCFGSVRHRRSVLRPSGFFRGGGRVERRCWVNFHCRGVLLVWMMVGQGPIVLAVGAGGVCLDIFALIYLFSFLSPCLGDGPI